MPEQLLGRIIRLCSNEGDLVLDPFSGSATTVTVAKKLGRRYLAIDLSAEYVARGRAAPRRRLRRRQSGRSCRTNGQRAGHSDSRQPQRQGRIANPSHAPATHISAQQFNLFHNSLLDAYRRSYDGYSLDRVIADPELNAKFAEGCQSLGLPGEARTWNWALFGLRKAGKFADIPTTQRTEFGWEDCDQFLFASEIAWRRMIDQGYDSLDTILCDPGLAAEFDSIAQQCCPGFTSLQYRWAALKLRKSAKQVRSRAELLNDARLSAAVPLKRSDAQRIPDSSGVYVVWGAGKETLYAGEANNLRGRLQQQFNSQTKPFWKEFGGSLTARFFATDCPYSTRLAYQRRLIMAHQPRFNLRDLHIA